MWLTEAIKHKYIDPTAAQMQAACLFSLANIHGFITSAPPKVVQGDLRRHAQDITFDGASYADYRQSRQQNDGFIQRQGTELTYLRNFFAEHGLPQSISDFILPHFHQDGIMEIMADITKVLAQYGVHCHAEINRVAFTKVDGRIRLSISNRVTLLQIGSENPTIYQAEESIDEEEDEATFLLGNIRSEIDTDIVQRQLSRIDRGLTQILADVRMSANGVSGTDVDEDAETQPQSSPGKAKHASLADLSIEIEFTESDSGVDCHLRQVSLEILHEAFKKQYDFIQSLYQQRVRLNKAMLGPIPDTYDNKVILAQDLTEKSQDLMSLGQEKYIRYVLNKLLRYHGEKGYAQYCHVKAGVFGFFSEAEKTSIDAIIGSDRRHIILKEFHLCTKVSEQLSKQFSNIDEPPQDICDFVIAVRQMKFSQENFMDSPVEVILAKVFSELLKMQQTYATYPATAAALSESMVTLYKIVEGSPDRQVLYKNIPEKNIRLTIRDIFEKEVRKNIHDEERANYYVQLITLAFYISNGVVTLENNPQRFFNSFYCLLAYIKKMDPYVKDAIQKITGTIQAFYARQAQQQARTRNSSMTPAVLRTIEVTTGHTQITSENFEQIITEQGRTLESLASIMQEVLIRAREAEYEQTGQIIKDMRTLSWKNVEQLTQYFKRQHSKSPFDENSELFKALLFILSQLRQHSHEFEQNLAKNPSSEAQPSSSYAQMPLGPAGHESVGEDAVATPVHQSPIRASGVSSPQPSNTSTGTLSGSTGYAQDEDGMATTPMHN